MIISNLTPDSEGEGKRDGTPSTITVSANDVYELISLKIKIYFKGEGGIGQDQIKQGHEFGLLLSLTHDADRKNFWFEIAVGPEYDQIHVLCLASDIDLAKALADLGDRRREKERQKTGEKERT